MHWSVLTRSAIKAIIFSATQASVRSNVFYLLDQQINMTIELILEYVGVHFSYSCLKLYRRCAWPTDGLRFVTVSYERFTRWNGTVGTHHFGADFKLVAPAQLPVAGDSLAAKRQEEFVPDLVRTNSKVDENSMSFDRVTPGSSRSRSLKLTCLAPTRQW